MSEYPTLKCQNLLTQAVNFGTLKRALSNQSLKVLFRDAFCLMAETLDTEFNKLLKELNDVEPNDRQEVLDQLKIIEADRKNANDLYAELM